MPNKDAFQRANFGIVFQIHYVGDFHLPHSKNGYFVRNINVFAGNR